MSDNKTMSVGDEIVELLGEMASMLEPLMRRHILRAIETERTGVLFPEEFAAEVACLARDYLLQMGYERRQAEQAMRETRRSMLSEKVLDTEELDEELRATLLVCVVAWGDTYLLQGQDNAFTYEEIGPDMLPRSIPENVLESIEDSLGQVVVTLDDLRRFLTFLHAQVADGKPLIQQMTRYLALQGCRLTNPAPEHEEKEG